MDDASNSQFDLYEIGAVEDRGTWIDAEWRRETRPKRIRPKSADDEESKLARQREEQINMLDGASFDTSSH